jgi:hypothetical protein
MINHPVLWTSQEAAIVTGGKNTRDWCATGVAISMADLKPGDLYIATQEDDLHAVFAKGAAAAIVTALPERDYGWALLKVPNTFEALQALAAHARFRTHATIVSVQGRTARCAISDVLGRAGNVHDAGRHLSLGLAGLPEDADFGLFGSSPAVRPDIAVITNCTNASRDTLFESMGRVGTVIINADDPQFLSVLARAKAACITNIFTYGNNKCADARLHDVVHAGNGLRLNARILGEEFSCVLPASYEFHIDILAAMLVLKFTDHRLGPAFAGFAQKQGFSSGQSAVRLIDPARAGEAVFRVTNMIDLGYGRQTAMLDNIVTPGKTALSFSRKELAIPHKLASLDFVYTSKRVDAVTCARETLKEKHKTASIEKIVPDVLVPGDYLVFKNISSNSKAIISEALRLIPWSLKRKVRVDYAL